jgi:hypothetical protein
VISLPTIRFVELRPPKDHRDADRSANSRGVAPNRGPANEGLRRRMCCSAAVISSRASDAPRQWCAPYPKLRGAWPGTAEPELIRLGKNGWITIGGGYDHENRLPAPGLSRQDATAVAAIAVKALHGHRATRTLFRASCPDMPDEQYVAHWTAMLANRIEALRMG